MNTKQVGRGNVTPVKANPLTLGKHEDTQKTNQLRKDSLVGLDNDADTVMDTADKCNMCSQLEVQAKLEAELNRVCDAGAGHIPFPGDVTEAVLFMLEEKNREGLVRWYPICGTGVGFAVVVNSVGVIEGWRAFAEADDGEYTGKPFQVQVVYTLAFYARSGRVKFWSPPKELDSVVACKHFEDIQPILEKELKSTNHLMELLASRR